MDVLAGKTYHWQRYRVIVIAVHSEQEMASIRLTNSKRSLTRKVALTSLTPTRETLSFLASRKTRKQIRDERREKERLAESVESLDIELAWKDPTPTTHAPGTPEKIQVMRLRYEHLEKLWHSEDAQGEYQPTKLASGIFKF